MTESQFIQKLTATFISVTITRLAGYCYLSRFQKHTPFLRTIFFLPGITGLDFKLPVRNNVSTLKEAAVAASAGSALVIYPLFPQQQLTNNTLKHEKTYEHNLKACMSV